VTNPVREKDLALKDGPSCFFVSVASKGFSFPVSPLESTLASILVSVADKGFRRIVRVGRLEGLKV
jgi:hypothetical protein